MRHALITALSADHQTLEAIVDPADPRVVRDEYKRLCAADGAGYAEIHLWESNSGIVARKKFIRAVAPADEPAAPPVPPKGRRFRRESLNDTGVVESTP